MAQLDDLPPLREVIRRHGLTPKTSLGQNFLFDLTLTARIARAAEPLENITVLEVGPGPGGLTRALLALGARRVIAIERDPRATSLASQIPPHAADESKCANECAPPDPQVFNPSVGLRSLGTTILSFRPMSGG